MNDANKMKLALDLAEQALGRGEIPIGAVVFQGNKAIAKSYTTENRDRRFLVHAELNVLIEVDQKGLSTSDRRNLQLFTTLEPCVMCFGAAMSCFVGEIVYSLNAPDDGATRLLDFDRFMGTLVQRQLPTIRGGGSRSLSDFDSVNG